jgi:nicotinate-nucleotide adenylyltransferase
MKRIGILGGSFNPIHIGHLLLAEKAKEEFKLDSIIFVPTGNPPHKDLSGLAPKEDRYKMVKLAIKGIIDYSISRVELDKENTTYAIDTIKDLKETIGNDNKLFYIMGLDSINEILTWKKPLELFQHCEFLVGTRPGSKMRTFNRIIKFPPIQKEVDKIHIFESNMPVSSSEIRDLIKNKMPIKGLVPADVEAYILEKRLYR